MSGSQRLSATVGSVSAAHVSGVATLRPRPLAWCSCRWEAECDTRAAAEKARRAHMVEAHPHPANNDPQVQA